MSKWPDRVYVTISPKGTLGPFASVEPRKLHQDDPENWPEREYIPLSKVRERLEGEDLIEALFRAHQRSDIRGLLAAVFPDKETER